jgi:hypothetical protein
MSSAILRACSAVVVGSILVATLAAQTTSSSRLQQIKQLNKVAAQKAEADIRDAVKEAVPLIKSDPSTALEVLEAALHTTENDTALDDKQRADLKKLIAKHIRDAKANGGKSSEPEKAATKQERGVAQRRDDEGTQRVDDIRKLLDRNRDVRQKNRELRGEQGRGLAGVAKDADLSAIPTDKDVKFPKNWKELTIRRSTVEMTKAEKRLMKALDTVIEANFNDAKFEDVIKYLEEKTGVSILLDKQAMDQQGVAYETTVRFRARKVTMRTVLRRILGDVGLAYIIKDEAIQVTTPDRAKETLTTRVYYLGDLVNKLTIDLGPALNEAQVLENAKQIIDMIQTQIEPESWSINNGPGRIFFEPSRMVLVVKASAEVHYMLGGGGK